MNVQNMLKYTADLSHGVTLTPLRMAFVRGEALAHMFIITAYENNQKVDLTGATVNGYMMRADQTTLTFDGSVSDGNAVISLPGAAYSVTGRFRLAIQATMNGVTTTLFYGEGAVSPSTTDIVAIPEEIIMPSLENIEAQVEEMVAATAAAKAVIKGAVVRNLLDNSNFSIWQRGETFEDSLASTYWADRWLGSGNLRRTYTKIAHGCRITAKTSGTYMGIQQRVPVTGLDTGTYTLMWSFTPSASCKTYQGATVSAGVQYTEVFPVTITAEHLSAGYYSAGFGVMCLADSSAIPVDFYFDVHYAALYEGAYTAETLPAYQPKGYAAELAECQRYYIHIGDSSETWLKATRVNGWGTVIEIPGNMRITPTVIKRSSGEIVIFNDEGAWEEKAVWAVNRYGASGTMHILLNDSEKTERGKSYIVTGIAGLSADL